LFRTKNIPLMILIADSGSTKADWKILHPSGEVTSQSTRGFNPFIQKLKRYIIMAQVALMIIEIQL
jgi:hypothetical protein